MCCSPAINCRRTADHLIDAFTGSGEAELMNVYAHPLAVRAVVEMVGMDTHNDDTDILVQDLRISPDAAEGGDPIGASVRVLQRLVD
ncbi:hypothetical protein [Streptomyces sp. NBC_01462]|uniref:hypothetical protein n=1 Tax=Streptomyces sp. NBC_01462 TaxID=2903876 RepID=UPI002E332996|nr:hypothetical protein [Streptomyces sp. NBC_01462]